MAADPRKDIVGTKGTELTGRKIALCVTGSVAAVKSAEIARELMRHGAEVHAVMTYAAQKLIHPNLLEWATGNPVVTELTGRVEHVQLAGSWPGRVDLVLIAPCTANTIGKIAAGIDDSPVTTVVSVALGAHVPVMIAPGMHEPMYENPLVIGNLNRLRDLGVRFVEPRIEEGKAKIAEVGDVVDAVISELSPKDMSGLKILTTAGPTQEHIDPVRIVTNPSSGKMGIAFAQEALRRGAMVTLIYGRGSVEPPQGAEVVRVETTGQLYESTVSKLKADEWDAFIAAAAPADYAPERASKQKILSRRRDTLNLRLKATRKVINVVKQIRRDIFLVAFKAEHNVTKDQLIARGKQLFQEAGADLVVANDVGRPGIGFGSDMSEAYVLDPKGEVTHLPLASKHQVARRVLDIVVKQLKERQ